MSIQIKRGLQHALFLVLLLTLSDCISAPAHAPQTLYFTVFHTMAHDASRFTQGFAIDHGTLYESAGLYGFSGVFSQGLRDGKTLHLRKNAQEIFAEGLAVLNQRVYQLSWLNHRGFIYDLSLNPLGDFEFDGEGWGLTSDGERLIMSDGSAHLRWLDAKTLQPVREVTVRDDGRPVERLNELEYVDGIIWANVWMTDRIAAIDAATGEVRGWLDLAPLKKAFAKPAGWDPGNDVLNGIAWDAQSRHFFVTGKHWPVMFELAVDPPRSN